jgi:para-nitrobenzyl esterase
MIGQSRSTGSKIPREDVMKVQAYAAAVAAVLAGASAAFAQAPPPPATEVSAASLVLTLAPAKGGAKLAVSTPAFANMGDIPFANTMYRTNTFPGLGWSKGPPATQSYAVIMQDTDGARNGDAILHWTMFNIPATVNKLDAGMTAPPTGAVFGPNVRGPNMAYMGPRTPAGPKHRYHLQVFALDTVLPADTTMTWDALKAALAGHVLASGQVIGLGQVDPDAPKPAAPPAAK